MTKAQIIAEHMKQFRSKGGKAKAARMSVEERREMALKMIAAKREKATLIAKV